MGGCLLLHLYVVRDVNHLPFAPDAA